ncbi:hypothetical protein A6R68_04494 [Neotoma lepida]|uniref:Uncharacterized protein n=1 Tax=Neotoma lepida TaxID=56216 RepID=A0A1A6GKZ5_NEOLE|nr:hypothetical protein A6R68_04494 [Neotoma lepida]
MAAVEKGWRCGNERRWRRGDTGATRHGACCFLVKEPCPVAQGPSYQAVEGQGWQWRGGQTRKGTKQKKLDCQAKSGTFENPIEGPPDCQTEFGTFENLTEGPPDCQTEFGTFENLTEGPPDCQTEYGTFENLTEGLR